MNDRECDRPGCSKATEGDWLYCSRECFDLDTDPIPVILRLP